MTFASRSSAIGASGLVFLPSAIISSSLTTAPFVSVLADGTIFRSTDFGTASFTWLLSGSASDYEVRFSIGNQYPEDFSGSALGPWLSLSSNREWTYIGLTAEVSPASILEIRKASPAGILASSDVSFFWNP